MSDIDEFHVNTSETQDDSDHTSEMGSETDTTFDSDQSKKRTYICYLINNGLTDETIIALRSGADPNERDAHGWLPVYSAVANGEQEVVKELLRHGASLSDSNGSAPSLSVTTGLQVIASAATRATSLIGTLFGRWSNTDDDQDYASQESDDEEVKANLEKTPAMQAFEALARFSRDGEPDQVEDIALILLIGQPWGKAIELGDPNSESSIFYLFWIWAVCKGYSGVVRALVEERKAPKKWFQMRSVLFDSDGKELVHILELCAAEGYSELVLYLLGWSLQQSPPIYAEEELSIALVSCARSFQSCEEKLIMVSFLLDAGASPRARCKEGRTALSWACERAGDHELVVFLLCSGAAEDANVADEDGCVPLHYASRVQHEWLETMRELLKVDAEVNVLDKQGHTPLWYAASRSSPIHVALLLERSARVDLRGLDASGELSSTPLMEACHRSVDEDDLVKIATLLAYGADVNASTKYSTPLGESFVRQYTDERRDELVWLLLDAGAEPLLPLEFPRQPLVEAVECTREYGGWVFELLDAIYRKTEGQIPTAILDKAVERAVRYLGTIRLDVLMALIWAGGNPCQRTLYPWTALDMEATGHTVLHCIARSLGVDFVGDTRHMIRYLLYKGADLDALDDEGRTPLHIAAKNGKRVVVEEFLANGANVDTTDRDGVTPLSLACQVEKNAEEMDRYTSWLVDRRDPKYATQRGQNIATGIQFGKWGLSKEAEDLEEVIHILREAGADVKAKDKKGMTPLHHACRVGNHISVAVLFPYRTFFQPTVDDAVGHDELVKAEDGEGKTALHWAVISNNVDIVRMVLSAKTLREPGVEGAERLQHAAVDSAYVEHEDHLGHTALHYAIEGDQLEMVELFLEELVDGSDMEGCRLRGSSIGGCIWCEYEMLWLGEEARHPNVGYVRVSDHDDYREVGFN